jgi:cyclic pyranopterin phosphate synthase
MLTHLNDRQQAQMVDISHKEATERRAIAQAIVQLPNELKAYLIEKELLLPKGAVLQTAVIAGTMAVKRTADAIPLCHPLPITGCTFSSEIYQSAEHLIVKICATVKTLGRTGVEMEALHGATIAALTIYDMCKAVSQQIIIKDIQLIAKSGGKTTLGQYPLYGLVLTGGKSRRMGTDKALLEYRGKPHAQYLYEVLEKVCEQVFLSARPHQWEGTPLQELPTITDQMAGSSPLIGILSAMQTHPQVNWLVVACDLPYLNAENLTELVNHYREDTIATAFISPEGGFPEALCAIYTPLAKPIMAEAYQNGELCPVKILQRSHCHLITPTQPRTTANVNTPEQYSEVIHVQL